MTTATTPDMRERLLERLHWLVDRTSMMVVDSYSAFDAMSRTLSDLAFLDGREEEYNALHDGLKGRFSKTGVPGIKAWFTDKARSTQAAAEVVSLYAEIGHALGYVPIRATIGDDEWRRLELDNPSQWEGRDWTTHELRDLLPEPSLHISRDGVWCFAPEGGPWTFFDFEEWKGRNKEGDHPRRLRVIRMPGAPARDHVLLTPYGRDRIARVGAPKWQQSPEMWLERAESAIHLANEAASPLDRALLSANAAERSLRALYAHGMLRSPANLLEWTPAMFNLRDLVAMMLEWEKRGDASACDLVAITSLVRFADEDVVEVVDEDQARDALEVASECVRRVADVVEAE